MALASMADVAILTYGTFGDYGALLNKDKDTYFPKNHPTHNETGVNFGIPRFYAIPWIKIRPN